MFLIICTFLSALYLAGIAAWFSVEGIMAIFSGLPISALCMGVGIEVAKIVSVSWLYRNWKTAHFALRYSALLCTLVALMLTSMGIFGYLSKAHLEQNAPMDGIKSKLEIIQYKIDREKTKIAENNVQIKQMDDMVNTLIKNDKISLKNGAKATREANSEHRNKLLEQNEESLKAVDALQEERVTLESSVKSLELEVGPIKYIANAIYGEQEGNLEKAVTFTIIIIMLAFDPFAIILLMCANHSLILRENNKKLDSLVKMEVVDEKADNKVEKTENHFVEEESNIQDEEEINTSQENIPLKGEVTENILVAEDSNIKIGINPESREQYVPAQINNQEDRLNLIKERLKRGEIGWLSPRKKQ